MLTGWNGLMMKAFAECGAHFNRPDWVAAAEANAEFILENLVDDGRLLRTWRDGSAKIFGYLEDYAFLVDGLISLYEATFDRRWLDEARFFGDRIPELFRDDGDEALYDTGSDHDRLIVRPRDLFDNAVPCGNSGAVMALLRLGLHTGDSKYQEIATSALRSVADLMQRVPNGFRVVAMRVGLPTCPRAGSGGDGRAGRSRYGPASRNGALGFLHLTASTLGRVGHRMRKDFRSLPVRP